MKKILNFLAMGALAFASSSLVGCSDDKDQIDDSMVTAEIGFSGVSADLFGGPTSYGTNLYYGDPFQITKGYIGQITPDTYIQFPINYAEQPWVDGKPWQYTFFNGGMALSNWHNMTEATYENQLSVYNPTSPSGGNFVVTFGNSSVTDPTKATLADYDGCGRIYITNSQGYGVSVLGDKTPVSGTAKYAFFNSVKVANTTYAYLTMKDGNAYAAGVNAENKGWFKVQFIAFDSNNPTAKPVGCVEAYLANFDESLESEAGFTGEIKDSWVEVDLTSLPETSILVVNFAGSDCSDYGLNTPCYCALDDFVVTVSK